MSELKIYNPINRLPNLFSDAEIEPRLRCKAEWKTIISEAQRKGKENRIAKLSEPRLSIEGSDFILDDDSYGTLSQAFVDSSGKYTGFPFKYPLDYYCTAVQEVYDTNVYQQGILHPLTATTFQVCKKYCVNNISSYKTINNIVANTITIYKDGILQTSGVSVNLTSGIVTFDSPPTGELTVSCQYRFKFRFDVDDLQLTLIRKVVAEYDGGQSVYKTINFRLIEDDYSKLSPLNNADWTSDIDYNFALYGSPEVTYSERILSFIESGDNTKEKREAFGVTRRLFKQESSNRKWKDIQRKYTLFNVAKGRLLSFDFEEVPVRFDQDEFSSESLGNNVWTFDGLSMIETLYPSSEEVLNYAHCIKIADVVIPPIVFSESITYNPGLISEQSYFLQLSAIQYASYGGGAVGIWSDIAGNYTGPIEVTGFWEYYYAPFNMTLYGGPIINGSNVGWGAQSGIDQFEVAKYPNTGTAPGIAPIGSISFQIGLAGTSNRQTIQLDRTDLSAVLSVKNSNQTITYTEGVDYEVVSLSAGTIRPLIGGAIADGQQLVITYSQN